jgi:hypothetical protein
MKISTIDREACRKLRDAINKALAPVSEELGVSLKAGNATYTPDGKTARFHLDILTTDDSGKAVDKDAEYFKRNAPFFGMKADDLGKQFKSFGGKVYELVGYNSKSRKFPFIAKDVATSTRFKFTEEAVKRGLGYA